MLTGLATVMLVPLAAHTQEGDRSQAAVVRHPPRFGFKSGEILARVAGTDKVYIERCAKRGLEKGTLFEVWTRPEKARRLVRKGWIRVDRVKEQLTRATILSVTDRFDPIAAGDRIWNPFVLRELARRPSFALLGERFGPWNRAQARRMIELAGAEVHPLVTPATAYLVVDPATLSEIRTVQGEEERARAKAYDEQLGLAKLFTIEFLAFDYLAPFLRDRLSLKDRPVTASVDGVNPELNTLMLSMNSHRGARKGMRFKIHRDDRCLGDVRVDAVHRGFGYATVLRTEEGARIRRGDRAVCDTLEEETAALLGRIDLPPLTEKEPARKPARSAAPPTRPLSELEREIERLKGEIERHDKEGKLDFEAFEKALEQWLKRRRERK